MNISKIVYYCLFVGCLSFGLIRPLNTLKPEITYPFFNWSLFDYAPSSIEDYMVRVTCEKDPIVKNGKFIFSLEDNPCLKFSKKMELRDRNRAFQKYVKEALLIPLEGKKFQNNFEEMLELKDYRQIVLYKRTYNPKELYFNKTFRNYEEIIVFNR